MDSDIRAQIKRIKIFTKRLVSNSLSGDYISAFKGSGMEFHQIREYNPGDDVRLIDWNSTVKSRKIMVKQFIEERDRTIILMIDVSASGNYASNLELKRELLAKVSSTLTLIANESNDKVGVIFFSDKVEKWIPPSRGLAHVNRILETIFSIRPEGKKTEILEALKFLISMKRHNVVVFMLSDYIDEAAKYDKYLKVAACKHDFIGMRILDDLEENIPDIGLIDMYDPESGREFSVDTCGLNKFLNEKSFATAKLFEKYKVDLLDLKTNKPFTVDLVKFFRKRIRRSI